MKIEYINGQRITPLPHELSPLDAAIERYREKAEAYYREEKSLAKSLSRQQREEKLKDAYRQLELERMRTEAYIEVQAQLAEYQSFGRKSSESTDGRAALRAEAHHPTKVLAKFMRAAGKPRPSDKHTPHHIVLGKGKTKSAGLTRLHIHRYGIRINDPDNGVWLVKDRKDIPHWSMPKAQSHLTIHTHNYETWILRSIRVGKSEIAVRQKLNMLADMLQSGNQPKHINLPPDDTWSGQ